MTISRAMTTVPLQLHSSLPAIIKITPQYLFTSSASVYLNETIGHGIYVGSLILEARSFMLQYYSCWDMIVTAHLVTVEYDVIHSKQSACMELRTLLNHSTLIDWSIMVRMNSIQQNCHIHKLCPDPGNPQPIMKTERGSLYQPCVCKWVRERERERERHTHTHRYCACCTQ